MVDLHGEDKGNISLPPKLHSYEDEQNKNNPTIVNMQRALYKIKITDIENKIERLENRNDELLEDIETTEGFLATVDAETAEEISNLSKQMYTQNSRVDNLKTQIDTVENDRIKNKQTHEDNVELLNQKYKEKKVELVSQIKVLNAKINTLEDFKKMQTALEEKFKAHNEQIIENNKKVKDVLESIKQKFEFDKEMLKNELYYRLLNLAAQFQTETNKHISLPNQRLMRENIMLKNELLKISNDISLQKEVESNFKSSAVQHRKDIVVYRSNITENIVTRKVQNLLLKSLQKKFEKMKKRLSLIKIPDPAMEGKCSTLIENAQLEERQANFYLSKLETLLHKERTKVGVTKYLQKRIECKLRAVVETLYDFKYIVMCLLKCPTTGSSYVKLLLSLQNKLIKGQLKFRCGIVKSVETILRDTKYCAEDLKEVPENVLFEITTDSDDKEPSYKPILDEQKLKTERSEEKEVSTGSSVLSEEPFDTTLFDIDSGEHLVITDTEFIEGEESLFDINEE